jgi:bifunctional UDP-N-acetylglucosamine pyrophosphorylase/glucosamine-1-phosphate N-acetyltransferase
LTSARLTRIVSTTNVAQRPSISLRRFAYVAAVVTPPPPALRAIILAAGLGTRMKSRTPKVLHEICGRPMLAYVIDAAREATGQRPCVVYSPQTARLCQVFADEADFALQAEPRGTGDALRAALAALPANDGELVVLSGDTPLIDATTVTELAELRRAGGSAMAVGSMVADEPTGYGRLVVEDGRVERIVEEKDATDEERAIDLINGGLYAFDAGWLRSAMAELRPSPVTGELYLTGLVEIAGRQGRPALTWPREMAAAALDLAGVNDRVDLADAEAAIQAAVLERHMLAGVTIRDPLTTWIDATVAIEQDVTLEPNVVLRGSTSLGRDSVIRSGSQIVDSTIGAGCSIWASVIEASQIGERVTVGPFAHLRGGCVVGDDAQVGNFAEQKNTRFGAGSKQHHFSYLGDAEVGAGVNIGAGTITANYDGRRKHRTVIGDGAFIGSDTILRAPVSVGAGAYTGAGSVVTRDVPAGKLAVGVPARIRERRAPVDEPEPAT